MQEGDRTFFKPLWRRVAVTIVCAAWCIWEIVGGDAFWTVASGAMTAYAVWTFFLNYKSDEPSE